MNKRRKKIGTREESRVGKKFLGKGVLLERYGR